MFAPCFKIFDIFAYFKQIICVLFKICNKAIIIINSFEYIPLFNGNFMFNLRLSSRKGHRIVIMVTYIKGDVFVLIKTFSIIFQVSVDRFLSFFPSTVNDLLNARGVYLIFVLKGGGGGV